MTHSIRTETLTAPRLIDANALLKSLDKQWMRDSYLNNERAEYIRQVMNAIHIAPTVETTDDVTGRLPERGFIWKRNAQEFWAGEMFENSNGDVSIDFPKIAETPLEAVKKLEASLNPNVG